MSQVFRSFLGVFQGVEEPVEQVPAEGGDQKNMGIGDSSPPGVHACEIGVEGILELLRDYPGN